jgi:hypothetical protein
LKGRLRDNVARLNRCKRHPHVYLGCRARRRDGTPLRSNARRLNGGETDSDSGSSWDRCQDARDDRGFEDGTEGFEEAHA